jgi:hypothetical protein
LLQAYQCCEDLDPDMPESTFELRYLDEITNQKDEISTGISDKDLDISAQF